MKKWNNPQNTPPADDLLAFWTTTGCLSGVRFGPRSIR